MTIHNTDQILATILTHIQKADKILIIASKPVDPDCIGTGLSLQWWLREQKKQADVVCFFRVPENMTDFPDIKNITVAKPDAFDFDLYGLIILVDGSSWPQFFGDAWQSILPRIHSERLVAVDHHVPEEIQSAIPDRCLNIKTSSTAQALYDYVIQPSGTAPSVNVAGYLYRALLYDTRGFKNEMHPGMFRFADALIALGADHAQAVDTNYDMRELEFMAWAIQHTEFQPGLEMSLLVINAVLCAELKKKFGDLWMDFDALYKEIFERQVKGYNYGIILIDNLDGTIRFNWRTRNCGDHLSIAEVAGRAGFRAGGHRNAGGGSFTGTIEEAKKKLLEEMKKALSK